MFILRDFEPMKVCLLNTTPYGSSLKSMVFGPPSYDPVSPLKTSFQNRDTRFRLRQDV